MEEIVNKYKISIIGSGYVGLSLGILLGQKNEVKILEIIEKKVSKINQKFLH